MPYKLDSATFTTEDANGWTVITNPDGTTRYRKQFSFSSLSVGSNATVNLSTNFVGGRDLPSGLTTIGSDKALKGNLTLASYGYTLAWNFEMTSSSSVLNITAINTTATSRSLTGWMDIEIETY